MSGVVSYDLFSQKIGNSNIGFTPEGGIFKTFINNTGKSVKGTIVVASTEMNEAVNIAPAGSVMPIGIIYESEIENLSLVKVVIYGRAQVLLKNEQAATHGFWCGVSDVDGRMYQKSTAPSTTEHSREIGHSLESKTAGTNVLAYIQVHFN